MRIPVYDIDDNNNNADAIADRGIVCNGTATVQEAILHIRNYTYLNGIYCDAIVKFSHVHFLHPSFEYFHIF